MSKRPSKKKAAKAAKKSRKKAAPSRPLARKKTRTAIPKPTNRAPRAKATPDRQRATESQMEPKPLSALPVTLNDDAIKATLDEAEALIFGDQDPDPSQRPKVYFELYEVDATVDPLGAALINTQADIERMALEAANEEMPPDAEVVCDPNAIPPDAKRFTGLTDAIAKDVALEMEEQVRKAAEARSAINKLRESGKYSKKAYDALVDAAGLGLAKAQIAMKQAVVDYHRLVMYGLVWCGVLTAASQFDAKGLIINIAAWVLTKSVPDSVKPKR
ncbi:MAG TPA: hypothetical protein VK157_04315 [Phycisphaerales bacterium]|nr:hypothetical protein [Phycisphaerales bacterium]